MKQQIFRAVTLPLILVGAIALSAVATDASAATITYNLTADPNTASVYNGNNGDAYTVDTMNLNNVSTGLNQLPGYTLNVGDTLSGTITFNSPLTIPASNKGAELLITLNSAKTYQFYYQQFLTFYDNGVLVPPPSGLNVFGGSGGALSLGAVAGNTPTLGFTFDQIQFNTTITQITNLTTHQSIASVSLASGSPTLATITYPASVPLPAASWFMLSGIGSLGALVRRKKLSAA